MVADRPIQEQVNHALNIFRDAFRDFAVKRISSTARGRKPADVIIASLRGPAYYNAAEIQKRGGDPRNMFDIGDFYFIARNNWDESFAETFDRDRAYLNALSQIASIRNEVSHSRYGRDVRRESAMSRVSDMADVLELAGKSEAQSEVRAVWDNLAGIAPAAPAAAPDDKPKPQTGGRNGGAPLKAWRDVIRPRHDVAGGTAVQSEFAASLSDVYAGRAERDYADPFEFFRHTYVTNGIRTLLVNTLRRLSGAGGEPVIQAKTVFGGGKTHSLIALYHLVNSGDALINPRADAGAEDMRISGEIREIMREVGLDAENGVPGKAAVIDCNEITATSPAVTANGDPLNAIWGEIAYQLGGQEAYDIVGEAARLWTAPGTAELRALFAHVGPCVILIDELIAYSRNIPNEDMRGKFFSFVQYLTEAARQSPRAALVITLPESDAEAGTDAGREALDRISDLTVLENIAARVEAVWHPLETRETFEVTRRRLFEDRVDEAERDRTCGAFADMYRKRRADYPPEAAEARYLERMKDCYPIHPEVFDRVFFDWSADPRFQRTRGALRVLAAVISRLYRSEDPSPLIMPGDFPLAASDVNQQFIRLLGDNWHPVLAEVDGDDSKPDEIDAEVSAFGEVGGASRRLARAIFLGSRPGRAIRGIDRRQLDLAVVRPSQGAAVYGDALGRMSGRLYFLYEENRRFFFRNQENLNRLAADRARDMSRKLVHAKIAELLDQAVPRQRRADVVACPESPANVPDNDRARLVTLPPDKSLPSRKTERGDDRDGEAFALDVLRNRAPDAARIHRNSLLFLAARRDDIRELERKTREFLAWESIARPAMQTLDLSGDRLRLASDNMASAKNGMDAALKNAYVHILDPEQPDGGAAEFRLNHYRTASGGEIIEAAFQTMKDEELLLTSIIPNALLNGADGWIWRAEDDHISISALWDGLANYVHAPFRLANQEVLLAAITQGVQDSAFGYAPRPEDAGGDLYPDLVMGELTPISETGVIVRKEMAAMVLDERNKQAQPTPPDPTQPAIIYPPGHITPTPPVIKDLDLPTRISATKTLDARDYMGEMVNVANEIVRNLFQAEGDVEVTVQITARKPDGFPKQTTGPVKENSAHLGLDYKEDAGV